MKAEIQNKNSISNKCNKQMKFKIVHVTNKIKLLNKSQKIELQCLEKLIQGFFYSSLYKFSVTWNLYRLDSLEKKTVNFRKRRLHWY